MIEDVYRLSPLQEGMLFESLYAPSGDAYVMQSSWLLGGDLDPAVLRRAWELLVERHAVLRTSFHWEEMERPHQVVLQQVDLPWIEEDWRGVADHQQLLEERRESDRRAGFDLQTAPLFRLLLVRLEDGLWNLTWTQHHLLVDGWSVSQVLKELFAVYQGHPLPPARPFREYIEWLLRRDPREAEAFWRRELAGFASPTPLGSREPGRRHEFGGHGRVEVVLETPVLTRHRLTLNTLVQGAWALLLGYHAAEEDVVFGAVVSGRSVAELPGIETAVGPFLNTIPLRARMSAGDRLLPWLAALQERQLEARRFEHSPLVDVQGWSDVPRDRPLFESLLAFEGSLYDPALREGTGGVRLLGGHSSHVSRAPITLAAVPEGETLHLVLLYDRDRFEEAGIARWSGHLRNLLLGMVEDPERALAELPVLTEAEATQLTAWGAPPPTVETPRGASPPEGRPSHGASDEPLAGCGARKDDAAAETPHGASLQWGGAQGRTIHDLFLAQVERTPDAVALVFEGERITYGELAERSARLARELGIRPEDRVAVSLPRSPRLVEALLAILQAGGVYVPLDPEDPPERREWIAADCGATLVIDERGWGRPSPGGRECDGRGVGGEGLAYVLYTSGTTGRPKGAMVPHAAVVNHLLWAQAAYGLQPGEACLLKTPIGFDVSVRELFWPLAAGARVVIARPGGERDPEYLAGLIEREGVTVVNLVPSLLAALLDFDPPVKRIIAGGETLSAELAERVVRRGISLHNHYGPTETAVNATAWECRPGDRPVPIGRPIANVRIDLLDGWGREGAVGEVHVGGAGVGRGYLNRPDLTAERFVPDPSEPGARRYRTGDLARWRPDGVLEFLGRIDHQLKVRGFRVEPEEIEAALAAWVEEAAVVAREGSLVAYVVGDAGGLRERLAERLPAWLVPSAFVAVDEMPRTASGKVDRRALARREVQIVVAGFEPPRTPVEEQVAEVWSEVLGRPRVGAHDDFFALGGHSLLALQVVTRLREAFGVEIPLRRLFEAPTPAALAREVETALRTGTGPAPPPLVPVSRDREIPLSFSQESLWLIHQLDPASPAYNVPAAVLVSGRLDPALLERTLTEIVRRHEALRTTFPGGRPVQRIHPPAPIPLPVIDLSGRPEEARRLAREEALRPFDLARGPLLRATLVKLGDDEHLVLLTMHHAVSDEWSVAVLVRELAAIYAGSLLAELPIQVADYAVWQREWLRGDALEARLAWWKERLAGAPPVIDLPLDRPRTVERSFRGGRVPFAVPVEGLRRLARSHSASLFMVLLAGFEAWLSRHGAGEDFVVGVPVANRSHPGTEGLIGFFVNTLPLRADLSGDPAFGELVDRAREAALGAFAHQDLPFERLVRELRPERSLAYAPLFQVMLAVHNVPAPSLELPGLSLRGLEPEAGTAKFDLVLELSEDGSGVLEYAADLFDKSTAERLARRLEVLLEAPDLPLSALPVLTRAERLQLVAWNRTMSFPVACLHRLFEARVRPDALAVDRLTYAELDQQANRLARRLRRLGVGLETRVALRHERAPGLIAGILGILKAGGAYVPIDPAWPEERARLILEDAGVSITVDEELLAACQESGEPLDVPVSPDNLAYVIYTSGSTGKPKGTLVTHANVSRLLSATQEWFGFGPDDVWTLFHSAAFDFSVWEIWGALAHGGRLVIVPSDTARSPEGFRALLDGVTVLNQTPSAFRQLAFPPPESLRWVIFGGEALDVSSTAGWLDGPRLVNMYGITETTVHVTFRPLSREDLEAPWRSPIGVPIPDLSVHIFRNGEPVPAGVPGELCVGGAGVARGYLDRPGLTAERFVPAPGGERLYRSGDLARRLPSGELEYLGRIDQQVKLRGFRIEPAEIEAALAAIPGVREAAVILRNDLPAGPGLVAYVVGTVSAGELLSVLRKRLPEHMVPGHFVFLPALPLTGNGKLDRRALPAPEGARPELARAYAAPRTPLERVLAGAWEEALGVDRVGIEDGFFDLGGHSLLATQMISWVRETFEVEVPLRELFERPTVAALAEAVEEKRGAPAGAAPIPRRQDPSVHPLSFAQERLWFLDRLDPDNPAYVIPSSLRLRGRLDVPALERALTEVVRRHEVLRATFHDEGGRPVQRISPPAPVPLEARREPIRLEEGPLLRARLLRLGEDDHELSLDIHHIAADGWSLGVLVRELTALYSGEILPELPIQYADWAAWQREKLSGEALDEQIAWWRERLAGAPPSLDLPFDRPRPAVQTFRGGHAERVLPAPLADRLRTLSGGEGASLFMVLLAGFQLLLARWSGQDDVPVGSPIAGRTRREVEGLIGIFLNHLVLRTDLSGDPTFRELLARVRDVAVGAFAHQDLPFEKLLAEIEPQRDLSRTPLFQVFFNLLNFPATEVRLPGLTVEGLGVPEPQAKFDMTLYLVEDRGAIRLNLVYNADLFDAPRMEEALGQYHLLLEQAAADPDARIGAFSLLTEAALQALPDPEAPQDASWPGPVSDAVSRHARETPDRPAVLWEGGQLTYAQLAGEMERIAAEVQGDVVAIQGHRSAPLVPAILGVMKAGAAFVILDPAYPEPRNAEILRLARPAAVLRPPVHPPTVETPRGASPPSDRWPAVVSGGMSPPQRRPTGRLYSGGEERDAGEGLAYIAFTSGSTGIPKGVLGRHRSLTHFYPWMSEAFDLGPDDRFSLLSGLAHDPLHRDVFTPLWLGAAVAIPDPDRMGEPGWLSAWMARMGVTVAHLTPAMGRLLTSPSATPMPALRRAFFVGDVLTRRDVERLRALAPEVKVVNLYGSTETQRAVGFHEVREDENRYPLGRGMPDVQLLVLDRSGRLCGIGEVGEVSVRSPHIAAGYLGGERFQDLYRTGDLGRYLPDGEVEPLGRADFQVKIRGFRVELGEVEAALSRHPAVREAVVIAKGEGDDRRLIAYVVPAVEDDLRTFLRARLPEYMVPASFVFLDALPLTPNRKVDRKALPEPAREEPEEVELSPIEELLAAIWSEVLGTDRIGPHDDFFGLGGHSLKVTQVLARVRDAFGVELPVRSLFETPTLSGLAARLGEAPRDASAPAAPPLVRVPRDGDLPLSFAQERLWFLHRLAPESPAYNMPAAIRLSGDLDPAALEKVLQEIVRRHETLRTTFPEVDGEPRQRVHPFRPFSLLVIDLPEIEAARLVREEAARPFDLREGPLLRALLLRLGEREWLALLCLHHVVSDGWSVGVLAREIAALYSGKTLPELPVQYADFAVWQRRWLELGGQAAWWREALADAPAVMDLPLDRPRSAGSGPAGLVTADFPAGPLRELGRRAGATLFMVLLAAFQAILHRLTGEDDLVVGTPIANRTHAGLEGLIGFFVNTLALRSRLAGDPTFRELLARSRATALGAYAHQDLPFEKLVEELRVERSLSHAPVFQVMLALQNAPAAELTLPGLTLSPVPLAPGVAKFELSISFGEEGRAALEYDARLFDRATAERLLERLGVLLEGIDPDRRLSELPVMGEAELRQVLQWSAAGEARPAIPVHRRFEEWAARSPEAPAVASLTYGELNRLANRLARDLRAAGAGLETRVAVSTNRPEGWPLGLLAVLKAGAAYVPLDPRLPAERREILLADSGASVLLADEALLPAGGLRAVCLDRVSRFGPETFAAVEVHPESLAYVIYTSGSTGAPKGVGVPHGALARHLSAVVERFGLGPGDRLLGAHADGFDAAMEQMLVPLVSGAALFPRGGELWSVPEMLERIERWGITVAQLPTAYWRQVAGRTLPPALRLVEAGGEAMPAAAARSWKGARLFNGYGPTEAVITPAFFEVTEVRDTPSGTVPIGTPVAGRTARVVDRYGQPVPLGVAGELWLGEPLARGYLGRPDATAEAFIPCEGGERLYRTGDRVRRLADGNLEYLGRLDRQVKVRGYRIEPGEVEAALLRDPAVREAAVVADGERLVAFLVPDLVPCSEPVDPDLHGLPAYMIPSAFVWLDALPLTPTGKVDRRALAGREVRMESGSVAPRDELERELAVLWEDLLGVHPVGARDDFFALGGHSLLAVRLASRIEARFGRAMPIATLFERRTVEALAEWLRPSVARSSSPLVRIQPRGSRPPLFMVHPGGGGVLCYADLARALGPDQPLYGLQAAGLDGERPPLDRIEEMAELYLDALAQTDGPVHLGGWSFGGLVAYEMACRLGERAGLVAILDVPAREDSGDDETELLLRGLDEEVPLSAEELRGLDTRAQVALLLERMPHLPPDFDERRAIALVEVFKANLRAARAWEPRPYAGKVTVFQAAASGRVGRDGGWGALARAVEVVTVPGDHHSLVKPPHVEALARALREVIP